MIFVFHTNRSPASTSPRDRLPAAVVGPSILRIRVNRMSVANSAAQAASITYAARVLIVAITTPAVAGPIIDAIWKIVAFHVTALLNAQGGTISGISDDRAGRPIVSAALLRNSITYIHGTDPSRYESIASATEHTAASTPESAMIRRRSNVSASKPPGSASAMTGMT